MNAAPTDYRRAVLFEDLDDDELAIIEPLVEYRRCPAETTIVRTGTQERSLLVILSGSVRIVKQEEGGQETPIAEVLPGEHLGEVTFVDGGERTATAVTNEATELLVFEPWRLQQIAETHPRIGFKIAWSLLRLLSRRLRNTDFWLFELMDLRAQPRSEG